LVAAFRATLEEVLDADLIVHVRDISHPQSEEQSKDVMLILESLGVAEGSPLVEVWNKIDRLDDDTREAVKTKADRTEELYAVSSITGEGLEELLDDLAGKLKDPRSEVVLTLSFAQGRERAWLFEQGIVTDDEQTDDGYSMTVFWTSLQKERFVRL
jgi:GTP-binding protein HflX